MSRRLCLALMSLLLILNLRVVSQTIKTVGSGGDYSTLALWETWADGQASSHQWAECIKGSDLGEFTMQSWTGTNTSSQYPKIYPQSGHEHNGQFIDDTGTYTNCAYVVGDDTTRHIAVIEAGGNGGPEWTQIVNMKFVKTTTNNYGFFSNGTQLDGIKLDGNLFAYDNANDCDTSHVRAAAIRSWRARAATNDPLTFVNNIIIGTTASGGKMYQGINMEPRLSDTSYTTIDNNSITGCEIGIKVQNENRTHYLTIRNNVVLSNDTDYSFDDTTGLTLYSTNNTSQDATASTVVGGTSPTTNITAASEWVAATNDLSITNTANSYNDGVTVSDIAEDSIGTTRPQGASYDRGAFEAIVPAAYKRRIIISQMRKWDITNATSTFVRNRPRDDY